jgi:hypothetical protein
MNAAMAMPSRRLEMSYTGSQRQNRWTVGFRVILAIPQGIVLFFVGIAAAVVVLIAWFGALFMGRLPSWSHTFLSGVVRWWTRYEAYLLLLTGQYPPFTFDDESYPARPVVAAPGALNRVAVFFRIILSIPAYAFLAIVRYGLTVPMIFVVWVITVVKGQMPASVYPAYAALVRYEARFYAYFLMLTSEYPWGMLGDPLAPAMGLPQYPPSSPVIPPPAAPPPAGPPMAGPPMAAEPFAYPPAGATGSAETGTPPPAPPSPPGAGTDTGPPVWPPPMPPPNAWERLDPAGSEHLPPWGTLVVQGAARGWMIFAIVWGSILFVGQNAAQSAFNQSNTSNTNNTNLFGNTGSSGNSGSTGTTGSTGNTP